MIDTAPVVPADAAGPDFRTQIAWASDQALTWAHKHLLDITLTTAAGVTAYILLNVLRRWGLSLCRRGDGATTWYGIIGRAIAKTGHIFMILAAARLVIGYASAPPSVRDTIVTLFTIAAVFQVALWVREIAFGAVEHRTRDQLHSGQAIASALGVIRLLVTVTVFAVAVVVTLGNLGVNVTGLVASLGVGGIAIGLAAQGIFADLFAALAILFDRPFRVGDSISYDKGAGSGTVEAIGLKSTRIRGGGGEERILANRRLLDFEILNTTRRLHNRFKYDFHIGYATPPEVIQRLPALLKEAVESEGYRLIHGGSMGSARAA
jgi:small-conductance mechanosensitive channel